MTRRPLIVLNVLLSADAGGAQPQAPARPASADFVELGVADTAPILGPVLIQAARATGLALRFDWTDGKSGGSDPRISAAFRPRNGSCRDCGGPSGSHTARSRVFSGGRSGLSPARSGHRPDGHRGRQAVNYL